MLEKTSKAKTKTKRKSKTSLVGILLSPLRAIKKVLGLVDTVMFLPIRLPISLFGGAIRKTSTFIGEKFGWLNKILEIPYTIFLSPVRAIRTPVRLFRIFVDKVAGWLYYLFPVRILSLYANAISGWLYNILNGTILLPSLWLTGVLFYFFPWVKEEYAWLDICLEGRMYLIGSLLYKTVTKIFLLIPVVGWVAWFVTLPFGYFLALWSIWVELCPVETLMPFLSRTGFPDHCRPGCVGKCQVPL